MTTSARQLIIIGAGGVGQEIAWAATNMLKHQPQQFSSIAYVDDDLTKKDTTLYGYPILGSLEQVNPQSGEKPLFICGVGNNFTRTELVSRAVALEWEAISIIDPSAIVAADVTIGFGTYIAAGVILSPCARLGDHIIINHHVSIGHDSTLEDFCQISPGGRVSGFCKIGRGATVGSNAVVAPQKSVGTFATLGAGSFAAIKVPDHATAIGVPAKVIFLTNI
jgi:sugar O-acyltransferase (sialic acid O-acetyltransferase NeuD family)